MMTLLTTSGIKLMGGGQIGQDREKKVKSSRGKEGILQLGEAFQRGRMRENWEEEFESHGEVVSKRSYREVISSWAEEELLWAEEELLVVVQVFSMLDTQSLCYTTTTCTMFHKSAMNSLCYATIDLTTIVPKVNNAAVFTMTQWVGKVLR